MFDPQRRIKNINDPVMGYKSILNRDRTWINDGRRAGFACTAFEESIPCIICGLDGIAEQLISFAQELLSDSFKTGEFDQIDIETSPFAYQKFYFLGMFRWFTENRHDDTAFLLHVKTALLSPTYHANKETIDIIVPDLCNSRGYDEVCHTFENYYKTKLPEDLYKISNPSGMSYCIAKNRLGQLPNWNFKKAMGYFLKRRVGELLGGRHFFEAATWMKMGLWDFQDNPPSPRDVLRMAYDFMPKVQRPF